MLSGSVFLRAALLLIAAALVAGLVQRYWVHDGGLPETPVVAAPTSTRDTAVAPGRAQPPPPVASMEPAPVEAPAPQPDREAMVVPRAAPEPAPVQDPPAVPAALPPLEPEGGQAVPAAEASADPRAVDVVNLNTGSLAQLNSLKGGGAIGRTIIQHRPYESIDQLLTKRVLNRATYQRVKDQVTVR